MKQLLLFFGIMFFASASVFSQSVISGIITTATKKEPIIGATVVVKGTSTGTITDFEGKYSLKIPAGTTKLVVSYIGFSSKEIEVGSGSSYNAELSEGLELENIVVIGSRNSTRTKLESAVPVDVIPVSQVINEVGQVDINQILTYIAPSFQSSRQTISDGTDHVDPAQLRGLGPDQVLVLVNGKRRHQSALVNVNGTVNRGTVGTDMNAIPATAVERIEILRDGAAAQYGSDAIAGVINIVLKQKTGVLTGNVSYGQHQTSYDKNYAWNILNPSKQLPTSVSASDGRTIQAGLNYGFKLGSKGFLNLTGEYVQRGATNRTGLYTGQVYPNVNGADRSDSIIAAKGQTRDLFDMRIGNSEVKGGGIVFNGNYALDGGWELYAFGGYNNKKGNAAGFYRYPNGVPAAARANVFTKYANGFLPNINSNVTDISAAVGVRGKLQDWNVELSNIFGQNNFDFSVTNSVNYTQALSNANFQQDFNCGGLKFSQNTTNLDISRKFDVLNGLNVAFGAESRFDNFGITAGEESSYKNYDVPSGAAAGAQVFAGFDPKYAGNHDRYVLAGYADLEQDITKDLMLGAAVRFENYSDFGAAFGYKAVGRYKIADMFSLRGSVGTGFRAPSMQQQFYAKTSTKFITVGTELQPIESGTLPNPSAAATLLGIPALRAEKSQNIGLGITARPLEGLEVTLDVYQININDRIVLTNEFPKDKLTDATLKAELEKINANSVNFFTNAIDTRARGLEAVIAYGKTFGDHDVKLILAGTFIKNEVIKGADGKTPDIKASQILINNGQLGNYFNREDQSRIEVAAPTNKLSATLNYKYKKLGVMVRAVNFGQVAYLDPTINPDSTAKFPINTFLTPSGTRATLDQTFSAKTVFDATISYQVTKGITIAVGGNNIFDIYQDKHLHSTNAGSGRFVYSRRVQQFGFNGAYYFARLNFNLK